MNTISKEYMEELSRDMADKLPVLRKQLKLSQEELSELVGKSRFTINEYETKKRELPWNMYLALVMLFRNNEGSATLMKALKLYPDALERLLKNVGVEKKKEYRR